MNENDIPITPWWKACAEEGGRVASYASFIGFIDATGSIIPAYGPGPRHPKAENGYVIESKTGIDSVTEFRVLMFFRALSELECIPGIEYAVGVHQTNFHAPAKSAGEYTEIRRVIAAIVYLTYQRGDNVLLDACQKLAADYGVRRSNGETLDASLDHEQRKSKAWTDACAALALAIEKHKHEASEERKREASEDVNQPHPKKES